MRMRGVFYVEPYNFEIGKRQELYGQTLLILMCYLVDCMQIFNFECNNNANNVPATNTEQQQPLHGRSNNHVWAFGPSANGWQAGRHNAQYYFHIVNWCTPWCTSQKLARITFIPYSRYRNANVVRFCLFRLKVLVQWVGNSFNL